MTGHHRPAPVHMGVRVIARTFVSTLAMVAVWKWPGTTVDDMLWPGKSLGSKSYQPKESRDG